MQAMTTALMRGTAFCLLLAIASAPAFPCSCVADGDITDEARQSDIVFTGKVLRLEGIDRRADSALMARIRSFFGLPVRHGPDEKRYAILVKEPLKGIASSTVEVVTAADSAACGYSFTTGDEYLVFAQRHAGRIEVSLCSSTARLDAIPADQLERLRAIGR